MSATRKKTWRELISAIHTTFRRWGINRYIILPFEAPERRDRYHTREQRMITVTFWIAGKEITLQQNTGSVAHDNLELMAIALETLRLNSVRGTDWICSSAYRQMHNLPDRTPKASADENDPYVRQTQYSDGQNQKGEGKSVNPTKQTYIELLQKALKAFTRIDLEEYEFVTGDEESRRLVAKTLRRMITTVELSDGEAWGKERPDRGE